MKALPPFRFGVSFSPRSNLIPSLLSIEISLSVWLLLASPLLQSLRHVYIGFYKINSNERLVGGVLLSFLLI